MNHTGTPPEQPLRLGALESRVMDVLWDHGPSTIREVIAQLPSEPVYTTIATVLTNLGRKDLITVTRQNRSTRYAARLNRHEHAAQMMEQVLHASRDRSASILRFVDSMQEDDLNLLRGYLERRNLENPS